MSLSAFVSCGTLPSSHSSAQLRSRRSTIRASASASPSFSRRSLLSLALLAPAAALIPRVASAARPEGVSRPDLLPAEFTSVIDLESFLASGEERRLRERLADLESRTGFKIRVLTQRYPVTPGLAVKDYWGLDDGKSVLLVADYFKVGHVFCFAETFANLMCPLMRSQLTVPSSLSFSVRPSVISYRYRKGFGKFSAFHCRGGS
jgi:hypothetical protein